MHMGGPGLGTSEGPLLPVADHAVSREHLRDPLGEGACEQLHVQLAQGYGPLVVQLGRARDLGAEANLRIPPLGWWRGATENGPVGVDEEPLDGCWEGLDEACFLMVGARGLAIDLVQHRLQVSNGVLLDLGPRPLRDVGNVVAEDRLEAGEVHWKLAVQLLPEGPDRGHHVMGLCQERAGVRNEQVPEA